MKTFTANLEELLHGLFKWKHVALREYYFSTKNLVFNVQISHIEVKKQPQDASETKSGFQTLIGKLFLEKNFKPLQLLMEKHDKRKLKEGKLRISREQMDTLINEHEQKNRGFFDWLRETLFHPSSFLKAPASTRFKNEKEILERVHRADSTLVPKISRTRNNLLMLEYINGKPLSLLISQDKKENLDLAPKFGEWLSKIHQKGKICIHDCNLRNVLYSKETKWIVGLDFEETEITKKNHCYSDLWAYSAHIFTLYPGLFDNQMKVTPIRQEFISIFLDSYLKHQNVQTNNKLSAKFQEISKALFHLANRRGIPEKQLELAIKKAGFFNR